MTEDITAALADCVKRMVPLVGEVAWVEVHARYRLVVLVNNNWAVKYQGIATNDANRWHWGRFPTEHEVLCLWKHHLRVELEKRGAWVQLYGGADTPDKYLVRRYYRRGDEYELSGGEWYNDGTFEGFDTHIDALMAGIEAVVKEEEEKCQTN